MENGEPPPPPPPLQQQLLLLLLLPEPTPQRTSLDQPFSNKSFQRRLKQNSTQASAMSDEAAAPEPKKSDTFHYPDGSKYGDTPPPPPPPNPIPSIPCACVRPACELHDT